jgi:two-component system sensor histidine kinase UhpB
MSQSTTDDFLQTALGRAERAEATYRSLVELIQAISYTEEVDSLRTFAVSPQIETILGYTQEEWMGDAELWIDRIHPDDRDRVVAACELANRALEPYEEEFRMLSRDGRVLWMHDEAVLVRDSNGQPLCWQGVMTVISPPGDIG